MSQINESISKDRYIEDISGNNKQKQIPHYLYAATISCLCTMDLNRQFEVRSKLILDTNKFIT